MSKIQFIPSTAQLIEQPKMDKSRIASSTVQTTEQSKDCASADTSTALTQPPPPPRLNPIITLRAGAGSYQAYRSLLPPDSHFFQAALQQQSSPPDTIDFPGFSFRTVRLYTDYLYSKQLLDLPCTGCPYPLCCPSPASMTKKAHFLIHILTDAHILGIKVEDVEFTKKVNDRLQRAVQGWTGTGCFPRAATVEGVFGRTDPGAAVRKLFCDVVGVWLRGNGFTSLGQVLVGRTSEERRDIVGIMRRVDGETQWRQRNGATR